MIDACLLFPDEDTAKKVLANFRYKDERGTEYWITDRQDPPHSLVIIGTMMTDAVYAEDGETIVTPPKPLPGFHLNIRCEELPEEAKQYEIHPTHRKFVFF